MRILKPLNEFFSIIVIFCFLIETSLANEHQTIEFWNEIKIKKADSLNSAKEENKEKEKEKIIQVNKVELSNEDIVVNQELDESNILIAGLFDPAENDLNIDMWSNSNGKEINLLLKEISSEKLSDFSEKIMDVVLLTNSYLPKNEISSQEFQNFTVDHLIKKKDFDLIEKFLIKNPSLKNIDKLVRLIVDHHLSHSRLEKSCEIFDYINLISDSYLTNFKIYCLINQNRNEEAQLLYDINSEIDGINDFFVKKFNVLMGYEKNNFILSDENILYFHLSHKTDEDFTYIPLADSPEFIWKYLTTSNLIKKIDSFDVENIEQVKFVEKAASEEIFDEKELLNLYKQFQFNIDQLISAKKLYETLPDYQGRALLYQRLILADNLENKLDFSLKLKKSFDKANLSKAFDEELSYVLKKINEREVPSNFTKFYWDNKEIKKMKKSKVKFNNKILHQSKVLNYFLNKTSLPKAERQINDLLKKVEKNKKYSFAEKDVIMLESLKSDGVKISENYSKLYEYKSNLSSEIETLIANGETGVVLLKLVKKIGKRDIEELDIGTLSFIVEIMNKLKIINLRNKLLMEALPLKV